MGMALMTDLAQRATRFKGAKADVELVQRASKCLAAFETVPTLAQWSATVGVAPNQLKVAFQRVLGVSPRRYAEAVRLEKLKMQLKNGRDVTRAMYEAGYGSSSRLYEKAKQKLGMTPGTYRKGGAGEVIRYATAQSPLGWLLVAATEKGICSVCLRSHYEDARIALRVEFPKADLVEDSEGLKGYLEAILDYLQGRLAHLDLPVDLRVTAFQLQVLELLRRIPYGETRSYSQIAETLGNPKAVRAVAQACGANPVPLLIPCHRVVQKDGSLGGYSMGLERKKALLQIEQQHKGELSE
jgi:AraC family transcriptional regulator of adaptative response/methylated-DNA-[protein]-cysteine methyltransferase